MKEMKEEDARSRGYIIFYGLLLASFGAIFGFGLTTFGTFFDYFIRNFPQIDSESKMKSVQSNLSVAFIVGGTLAVASGGPLYSHLGRYRMLVVMMVIEVLALAGMAHRNLVTIGILRIVLGYCCGFWMLLVPTMLHEMFPKDWADWFGAGFGVALTGGICLSYCLGFPFAERRWRCAVVIPALFEGLKLIAFLVKFNMESPVFLATQVKDKAVLQTNYAKMYKADAASKFATAMAEHITKDKDNTKVSWDVVFSAKYSKQIMLGITLNLLNQLTGINYFNLYINRIFKDISEESTTPHSILYSLMGLAGSLVVLLMLKSFSKRTLIVWGLFGQVIALSVMILGAAIKVNILKLVGPFIYTYAYAHSLGGIMYLYCTDIVPSKVFPVCVFFQWVFSCLFAKWSLFFADKYGNMNMLMFFQVCAVLGTSLFIAYSVKTENKKPEEILKAFEKKGYLTYK